MGFGPVPLGGPGGRVFEGGAGRRTWEEDRQRAGCELTVIARHDRCRRIHPRGRLPLRRGLWNVFYPHLGDHSTSVHRVGATAKEHTS